MRVIVCVTVIDKQSPRGDGNSGNISNNFPIVVIDKQSPRGDGNFFQDCHTYVRDTVIDKQSPRGDGNGDAPSDEELEIML